MRVSGVTKNRFTDSNISEFLILLQPPALKSNRSASEKFSSFAKLDTSPTPSTISYFLNASENELKFMYK